MTKDFESFNPGSNPGETFVLFFALFHKTNVSTLLKMSDNNIIIGKYFISKTVLMSYPRQFYYYNSETKETKTSSYERIIRLLLDEKLDPNTFIEYVYYIDSLEK
jgi:hypothetical protein